jgi:hypothetical protein
VFVEGARPPLGDLVLDLILHQLFVGALSECGLNRLLMKLIELVIKTRDHVLDLSTLLLCLQPFNYRRLDLSRPRHRTILGLLIVVVSELPLDVFLL